MDKTTTGAAAGAAPTSEKRSAPVLLLAVIAALLVIVVVLGLHILQHGKDIVKQLDEVDHKETTILGEIRDRMSSVLEETKAQWADAFADRVGRKLGRGVECPLPPS